MRKVRISPGKNISVKGKQIIKKQQTDFKKKNLEIDIQSPGIKSKQQSKKISFEDQNEIQISNLQEIEEEEFKVTQHKKYAHTMKFSE